MRYICLRYHVFAVALAAFCFGRRSMGLSLCPFHSIPVLDGAKTTPPLARRPPLFGQKGRRDVCINLARIFKLMMLNGRTKNTKYACRMQATVSSCGSVCVRNVHHNCTAMIHTLAQHGDIHKPKTEPKAKGFRAGQKPNQRTNGQQNILAEKESELAAKGTFWGFSNTNLGIHCNKRLNLNW